MELLPLYYFSNLSFRLCHCFVFGPRYIYTQVLLFGLGLKSGLGHICSLFCIFLSPWPLSLNRFRLCLVLSLGGSKCPLWCFPHHGLDLGPCFFHGLTRHYICLGICLPFLGLGPFSWSLYTPCPANTNNLHSLKFFYHNLFGFSPHFSFRLSPQFNFGPCSLYGRVQFNMSTFYKCSLIWNIQEVVSQVYQPFLNWNNPWHGTHLH